MDLTRRHLLVGIGSAVGLAACSGAQPGAGPATSPTPSGVLGTATSPSASSTTGSSSGSSGAVDWSADLDALVAGIESTHPNAWWREPRSAFLAQVETLKRTLPAMDRRAQEVAVMELVATIDGHTAVYPTDLGWHFLAIQFYEFSGTTIVTAYPGRPDLVGATLEGIGDVALAEARRRLRPLANYDNDQTITLLMPLTYVMPEALGVKGLVPAGGTPSFHLRTTGGERVTVTPSPLDYDGYVATVGWDPVGLPPRDAPLVLTRRREPIWWSTLPGGALHVVYNQVQAASKDAAAPVLAAAADPRHPGVIIDIRNNPGGNNQTYAALLEAVRDPRLRSRRVLVIGRATFSAAMNFAVDVEQSTDAVFVGEATGARPNLYGDVRPVRMPSSGLVANVSSRYWPKAGPSDTRTAIEPDVKVEWTAKDFLAGRDPVLDAAVKALR